MQHGLTTIDNDEEPANEHRRGRAAYGATEWIDMRQSSTARASTTCSMATLKTGSRIPETETEPASLWRLSGHKCKSTARASNTCSMARHTTRLTMTSNNYSQAVTERQHGPRTDDDIKQLQPSGDREAAWTENDDFGSDDEQAASELATK